MASDNIFQTKCSPEYRAGAWRRLSGESRLAVDLPFSGYSFGTQPCSNRHILARDWAGYSWKRISSCEWHQPQSDLMHRVTTTDMRGQGRGPPEAEVAGTKSSHCAQDTVQEGRGTIDVRQRCFLHELPMHAILAFLIVYGNLWPQRASGWTMLPTLRDCMYRGDFCNWCVGYYGPLIVLLMLTDKA